MLAAGFAQAVSIWGFMLFHKPEGLDAAPILLPGERGVLFGSVFKSDGERLTQDEVSEDWGVKAAASGGDILARGFWGDYVAFLIERAKGKTHAVRGPTGGRPIYIADRGPVWAMFSHAEDFVAALGAVSPSLRFLRGFLRDTHFMTSETGLEGVSEIEVGTRVSFYKGQCERAALWWPSQFPTEPAMTFNAARDQIRAAVELSAGSWARSGGPILHRLSGGLDSSILLGAMRKVAPSAEIICGNESATDAIESDERAPARSAADAFGVDLVEFRIRAADAQLSDMFAAPLTVSPTFSVLSYANPFLSRLALERGVAMVTNGEGGDQLFHRAPGPYAVADAARLQKLRRAREAALDAAHISGDSVWSVLGFALCYGVLRRRFDVRSLALKTDDLTADRQASATRSDHFWLEDADLSPPGRAVQIAHLLDAITQAGPLDVTAYAQCPLVLCSQPIAETCLRIPPYLFFEGGQDRALWRAAFGDLLPPAIQRRQTKASTTRYFAALLEHNRGFLRERLLDGRLLALGIVARGRLEDMLARQVWSVEDKHHLLTALCCEAWLAQIDRVNRAVTHPLAA